MESGPSEGFWSNGVFRVEINFWLQACKQKSREGLLLPAKSSYSVFDKNSAVYQLQIRSFLDLKLPIIDIESLTSGYERSLDPLVYLCLEDKLTSQVVCNQTRCGYKVSSQVNCRRASH